MDTMLSLTTSVPAMADIYVYSADRQLVVAIEFLGTYSTPEYLERMRSLVFEQCAGAKPLYILLVRPSHLHLWRGEAEAGTKPQSASTLPIIQALAPTIAANGWVVSRYSLRMLITTWLDKFTLGFADVDSEADQLIVQSGIYDRMRNGSVEVVES